MTEQEVEQAIQARGLRAPRLSPPDIDAAVVRKACHHFCGTTLTVCALTLRNGHIVVGYSRPVSLENFDAELGREVARNRAREQVWELEGYRLRQDLFD